MILTLKKSTAKALLTVLFSVAALTLLPLMAQAICEAEISADCNTTLMPDCTTGASCGNTANPGTCQVQPPATTATCIANPAAPTADTGTAAATTAQPLAARELPNPLGNVTDLRVVIGKVITMFTGIAGSLALLMFVYGGVMWLISGGSEERIKAGRQAIVWSTIGLFVIFGSYAILRIIFRALGAEL
ncbi:MAG: pilin [Patescibacteria group bacterium]